MRDAALARRAEQHRVLADAGIDDRDNAVKRFFGRLRERRIGRARVPGAVGVVSDAPPPAPAPGSS